MIKVKGTAVGLRAKYKLFRELNTSLVDTIEIVLLFITGTALLILLMAVFAD